MEMFIGNCRKCGYSLARLTQPRCPECGTAFNPDDPSTMELTSSPLLVFLRKKNSIWTIAPLLFLVAMFIGARFGHYSLLADILVLPGLCVLSGTFYIVYARLRFQHWLRSRRPK